MAPSETPSVRDPERVMRRKKLRGVKGFLKRGGGGAGGGDAYLSTW